MNKLAYACAALMLPMTVGFAATAKTHTIANSGIVCHGEYQIVEGQSLSTPYCADAALAKEARSLGDHVSATAVRNNPELKDETCLLVGIGNSATDCPDPGN